MDVYDELYRNKIKDIDEDEKVDNKNDNKNKKSKKDIIQTEKEKYQKLSETFIKIKCLLNLDCEPGNEREYIKNYFKTYR